MYLQYLPVQRFEAGYSKSAPFGRPIGTERRNLTHNGTTSRRNGNSPSESPTLDYRHEHHFRAAIPIWKFSRYKRGRQHHGGDIHRYLVSSIQKSDNLALAMDSRCYGTGDATELVASRLNVGAVLLLVAGLVLLVAVGVAL